MPLSFSTRVQKAIIDFPHPLVLAQHGAVLFAAFVISAIPDLAETHKSLLDYDTKISEASSKRKQNARERIVKLEEIEQLEAEHAAQIAEQEAGIIKNKETALSQKRVTETQTQSDVRVIKEEEQGNLALVHQGEKHKFASAHQNKTARLQEQLTAHETAKFSRTQKHLETMTDLSGQLKSAADSATDAATTNITTTEAAFKSVLGLNKAMSAVIKASSDLQSALDNYDIIVATGEMDVEKAAAISQALMQTMKAEKQLETQIATTHIEHKADLKQALMQDVADNNNRFDDLLSKHSKETLTKLSELIQTEIETQQESLAESDETDIQHAHLEKLVTMLDKVHQINLGKSEADTTSIKQSL